MSKEKDNDWNVISEVGNPPNDEEYCWVTRENTYSDNVTSCAYYDRIENRWHDNTEEDYIFKDVIAWKYFEYPEPYNPDIQAEKKQKESLWNPANVPPDNDRFVLVSFSNFSVPDIGGYRVDEDESGAYYPGDEEKSYSSYGLFVNGWMELPKCKKD